MEGGKPEGPRKKLLECGWEPTTYTNNTNSTHCDARSRNWTWVTVVVGKPSHQCLWLRNYVTLRLGCAGLSIFSLVGIHSMGAGAALRKLTDIHVISTFSVLLFKCVVDFILFTSRHVLFICKMVLWKEPNFWNSVWKSPPPPCPQLCNEFFPIHICHNMEFLWACSTLPWPMSANENSPSYPAK